MLIINKQSILKLLLLASLTIVSSAAISAEKNTYNRASYSVTERMEVNNDEITIVMAINRDNEDATKLSNEINQVLISANTSIKKFPTIKSSTSAYSVNPIYNKDKRLDHWRGAAIILLKSTNIKDMVALVQVLQNSLTIKSTQYNVSAERKDKLETGMIEAAMKKFNQRADMVSKGMGFKKYRLVKININSSGNTPRPVYAMAANSLSKTRSAPPTFDAGQSVLKVTVSGTVEMEVSP